MPKGIESFRNFTKYCEYIKGLIENIWDNVKMMIAQVFKTLKFNNYVGGIIIGQLIET